jgi:hypothetical protein
MISTEIHSQPPKRLAKAFIRNELPSACGVIFANQGWTYFGFETSLAAFACRKKEIGSAAKSARRLA